jgi:mRNA interferase MazF
LKRAGQIALMPFPYTNLHQSKRRPVLLLRQLAVSRDDWLVCMVSSRIRQADPDLDWVLHPVDPEFASTGLKVASVFRLSRLAVLDGALLLGHLGEIPDDRLCDIRGRLARWLVKDVV